MKFGGRWPWAQGSVDQILVMSESGMTATGQLSFFSHNYYAMLMCQQGGYYFLGYKTELNLWATVSL